MSAEQAKLQNKPIGPADFDEFGDTLWLWFFVPLFAMLVHFLLTNPPLSYMLVDLFGEPVVVLSISAAILALFLVFAALALQRSETAEGRGVGPAAIIALVLIVPVLLASFAVRFLQQGIEYIFEFGVIETLGMLPEALSEFVEALGEPRFAVFVFSTLGMIALWEIVFRGILLGGMLNNGNSKWASILTLAAVEALMLVGITTIGMLVYTVMEMINWGHFDGRVFLIVPIIFVPVLLASALLGYIRTAFGSIVPGLVLSLIAAACALSLRFVF